MSSTLVILCICFLAVNAKSVEPKKDTPAEVVVSKNKFTPLAFKKKKNKNKNVKTQIQACKTD